MTQEITSPTTRGISASLVHGSGSLAREYLSGWQRARAELTNLRQRLDQEMTRQRQRSRREVFDHLIPLADNFEAMVKHVPAEFHGHAWTDGVLHIARQLEQLMSEQGINHIEAINQPFDPARHEAIAQVTQADAASGTVVEVVQSGYMFGDQVWRPAKVKVAK